MDRLMNRWTEVSIAFILLVWMVNINHFSKQYLYSQVKSKVLKFLDYIPMDSWMDRKTDGQADDCCMCG